MVPHLVMISTMEHKVGHFPTHTVPIGRRNHVVTTARVEVRFEPMPVRPTQLHLLPISLDAPTSRSMHGYTKVDQVVEKRQILVRIFNSSTRLQAVNGQRSIHSKAVVHKPAISNIRPSCQQQHSTPLLSLEFNKHQGAVPAVTFGSLMM